MSLTDFSTGVLGALHQRMAQQAEAQKQQILMQRQAAADSRAQQSLDIQTRGQDFNQDRMLQQDRAAADAAAFSRGTILGDSIPAGTVIDESDPIAKMIPGALMTRQEARPAVAEGPLLPGDTGAAKKGGFLKTASQKQIDTNTDNERQANAEARQMAAGESAQRHQQAMERIAQQNANSTSENRSLTAQLNEAKLAAATTKQADADAAKVKSAESAQNTAQAALGLVKRLREHPGMESATGAYEMRGFTQGAQDFNKIRDQLTALLALPNLGSLKGPMSDKDILFVKQLATRIGGEPGENTSMSEAEFRRALDETEATFNGGASAAPAPGAGGGPKAGQIKVFPNGRKGKWDGQGWVPL